MILQLNSIGFVIRSRNVLHDQITNSYADGMIAEAHDAEGG